MITSILLEADQQTEIIRSRICAWRIYHERHVHTFISCWFRMQ